MVFVAEIKLVRYVSSNEQKVSTCVLGVQRGEITEIDG
jgi:hypothetical protein